MFKRFLKSAFAANLMTALIGLYLRMLHASTRKTVTNRQVFDDALSKGQGVILAFWHGRLITTPFLRDQTHADVHMLISRHRDGEIIANAVRSFGVRFVRGSAANPKKPEKSKHGASAVAGMLEILEAGQVVAITPDGPRGPAETAQTGAVKLAQMSGAPIIAVGSSASRARRMNSWDRFLLVWPFSHIHYVAGSPLYVPEDANGETLQELRRQLETNINDATTAADEYVGRRQSARKD